MGLKIGEVDIYTQTINHEYQIDRILRILDIIIQRTGVELTQEEIKAINTASLQAIQNHYPNSGVKFSSEEHNNDKLL
jgi:hypothetical protein